MAAPESATKIMLGALAGGLVARTADEAAPTLSYQFTAFGRTFTVRATTAAGLAVLAAAVAGLRIPGESVLVPMAAGALAYESTAEVGDDLAALALGLPMPGAPVPAPAPAPGLPLPASSFMYPGYYGGQVDDYTFGQARAALGRF